MLADSIAEPAPFRSPRPRSRPIGAERAGQQRVPVDDRLGDVDELAARVPGLIA